MVGDPYRGRGTGVFDKLSPDGASVDDSAHRVILYAETLKASGT